jgi:hypothetical protein
MKPFFSFSNLYFIKINIGWSRTRNSPSYRFDAYHYLRSYRHVHRDSWSTHYFSNCSCWRIYWISQTCGATPSYSTREEDFLRKWATTFKAVAMGKSAVVDPLLKQLLGRELVPMKDTLIKLFKSEQTSKWYIVYKANFINFISCMYFVFLFLILFKII